MSGNFITEEDRAATLFILELNGIKEEMDLFDMDKTAWVNSRVVSLADVLHLFDLVEGEPRDEQYGHKEAIKAVRGFRSHDRFAPAAELAAIRWLIAIARDRGNDLLMVRCNAVRALGEFGRKARIALPVLFELLATIGPVDWCQMAICGIIQADEDVFSAIHALAKQDEARLKRRARRKRVSRKSR